MSRVFFRLFQNWIIFGRNFLGVIWINWSILTPPATPLTTVKQLSTVFFKLSTTFSPCIIVFVNSVQCLSTICQKFCPQSCQRNSKAVLGCSQFCQKWLQYWTKCFCLKKSVHNLQKNVDNIKNTPAQVLKTTCEHYENKIWTSFLGLFFSFYRGV